MNNEIVVIYKEVGKSAEFKKIKNDKKSFKDLIGDELDYIPYKDIIIIARKNRNNLNPNIYLNTSRLNIYERNIRGNIVVTSKENDIFKSLTENQAMEYRKFLEQESFHYEDFKKIDKHIFKNNNNYLKNKRELVIERELRDNDRKTTSTNTETNGALKMILGIQAVILKFIKNNEE